MKNLKQMVYGAASSLLALPVAAGAQFQEPTGTGLPAGSILGILTSAMNWLLIVVGILGVIGFVIAGILYLTAAGDEGQMDKGKKAMIYSLIGIIVALIGVIVMQAVKSLLTGTSKSF